MTNGLTDALIRILMNAVEGIVMCTVAVTAAAYDSYSLGPHALHISAGLGFLQLSNMKW